MGVVLVIANQKGGVGKTSICVHTAFHFAEKNYRVAFIDTDPQENASLTLSDYAADGIVASQLFGTGKLPALPDSAPIVLIRADQKLYDVDRAEMSVIQTFVTNVERLASQFDVVIIDTSPTLGVRTTAALFAADFVLSPVQVESYSVQGTHKLLQTILGVGQMKQKAGHGELKFLGMLPNLINNTSPMHKDNLRQLVSAYPQYMFPLKLSNRTSVGEALADKMPVWKVDKSAAREAAKEMRAALNEVMARMSLGAKEPANG